MNKHLFALLALAALSNHSLAHEFWLFGSSKEVTSVDIGYADDFPTVEKIPDNRIALFEAPYIINKNGEKLSLKQSGENYHYERAKLEDGSYLIAGEYKPTFWTKASDGTWHMGKTKEDIKDAKYCKKASMSAKGVINKNAKDDSVTKPSQQRLEIVPLDNPANFKVGVPFKVKILFEGKPLENATLDGTFDGFLKEKSAFHGQTEPDGTIEVLALKPGKWLLQTVHKMPFANSKICDDETIAATLAFELK